MNIIGIIGEGKMGTNLFHYISDFPFELRWLTSPDADVEKMSRMWSKKVLRNLNTDLIDQPGADRRNRAVISKNPESLNECDLIIEALPERENLKLDIFRKLDPIAPPACIFASNSSSILPSRLSPSERRNPNTVGIHFFYPVSLKNIAELVVHAGISPLTIERSIFFLNTIRRKFLLQHESDAFILNRIYLEIQAEAWHIVHEGLVSPLQLDHLVRSRLFPLGPFDCMDVVGMDVMLPAIRNYTRHYQDQGRYQGLLEEIEGLVAAGRLGKKSGKGFFDHSECGGEQSVPAPPLQEEVARKVVMRVKEALNNAIEKLCVGVAYPKEDLLAGLKEYFGV